MTDTLTLGPTILPLATSLDIGSILAWLAVLKIGMDQIGIGLFGVTAIWLSQDPRPRVARWACIAGLCAQPFWLWTTFMNHQWAIFLLSFFYTWSWSRGVRTYWLKPRRAADEG